MTLETPKGNRLVLDEDKGGITIEDQNGNKIVLDSKGITLESASKLQLKAAQDVKLEGLNVNFSAQAALKAEGTASAEISASGTTTVKGGVVMIN
jgi:phage gp45-like